MVILLIVDLHAVWIPNLVRDHGDINVIQPQASLCVFGLYQQYNGPWVTSLFDSASR